MVSPVKDAASPRVRHADGLELADWVLRTVIALNLLLFGLAFVPAFSGIGPAPGLADRLWGNARLAGWRADVVWMAGSSLLILAGTSRWTREASARKTTAILCLVWLPLFVVYLRDTLIHMFG
jgi:hypothetical protein